MKKTKVLQITDLPEQTTKALTDKFDVVRLPKSAAELDQLIDSQGEAIEAIAGMGSGKVDAELLSRLPNLKMISTYTAGQEGIDVAAAEAKGIAVANTSHILAQEVADTTLWLLLTVAKNALNADKYVREGKWQSGNFPLARSIASMKIGILGLGHIGQAVAQRLDIMGAETGYFGRGRKSQFDYRYFSDLKEMATWCDVLVVACPGGAETYRIVNEEVIAAVGPQGYIVNIARGSVIDEEAMVEALKSGGLGGAGLDVFADEPNVPQALIDSDRVALLPHIGSATLETRRRMGEAMITALEKHFGAK
ncbi:2-hydroxyacid dehydrogenase [Mesorhizobium sp. SB112]|uniref:2-hydroxyacid dehydrogenase n=1 Tax=Mesorhizobium sp. SB112 TaxID=3151853 RepID=UPI0032649F1E